MAAAAGERRRRVHELRLEGKSFREIAAELGCSVGSAFRDWEAALAETPREGIDQQRARANELLDVDDGRLDRIIRKLLEKAAEQGDEDAARTVARLIEKRVAIAARRAKLNGIDAPERIEHTGVDGGPIGIHGSGDADALLGRLATFAAKLRAGAGGSEPDGGGAAPTR